MEFPSGPWETVFSASQSDYDTRMLANDSSELIVEITEKKNGKKTGQILELFKVFVARENPGNLLEKLSFPALEIALHPDADSTLWFVFIDSGVVFSETDSDTSKAFSGLEARIHDSEKHLQIAIETLGYAMAPFSEAGSDAKSAFFSGFFMEPFLIQKTRAGIAAQKNIGILIPETQPKPTRFGQVKLGITREGSIVEEPLALFKKTLIVGGTPRDRVSAIRILVESALLSGFPAVLFETGHFFDGIKEPSKNIGGLKESKLELAPLGFPSDEFEAPERLRINFSELDIESVLELFRLGHTPAYTVIKMVFELGVAANLPDLIEAIKIQSPGGEVTRFHIHKAMRIVSLMDQLYPGFFNGPNRIPDIAGTLERGLGKAGVIRLNTLDNRMRLILVHSLVREIRLFYQKDSKATAIAAMLFFPEIKNLFPYHQEWKIQKKIRDDLMEAAQFGIGVAMSAEKTIDVNETLASGLSTEIGIVTERDAGVRIEKRKPYRVQLRPTLTCVD